MSLISSRVSLKHRCTIERNVTVAANAWGNAAAPVWQTNLSDLPCRLWTTAGREVVDATTTVVVEDMRLIVALNTDITEEDRIANVTYRGDTIAVGPIGIRAVMRHQDHLEIVLVRVA